MLCLLCLQINACLDLVQKSWNYQRWKVICHCQKVFLAKGWWWIQLLYLPCIFWEKNDFYIFYELQPWILNYSHTGDQIRRLQSSRIINISTMTHKWIVCLRYFLLLKQKLQADVETSSYASWNKIIWLWYWKVLIVTWFWWTICFPKIQKSNFTPGFIGTLDGCAA